MRECVCVSVACVVQVFLTHDTIGRPVVRMKG